MLAGLAGNPTGLLHALTAINLNFLGLALIMFFILAFLTALLWKRITRAGEGLLSLASQLQPF
ncbi:hypothetical protein [Arthrobacter sp. H5]|uniref:hypothetical protein n=1 Tax=Arthrobacter sp. H5 TaxID=1267973 RepID=UPI0004805870|nr:hypothetical protein [Arthrobacter sp. H5]